VEEKILEQTEGGWGSSALKATNKEEGRG